MQTKTVFFKSILIKHFLLVCFICVSVAAQSQRNPEDSVRFLRKANVVATIQGNTFDTTLHIKKGLLDKGFKIELSDNRFEIIFFMLTYDCPDCDIWEKRIHGNQVTPENAKILKHLVKDGILSFDTFKIRIGKEYFTLRRPFYVVITD